MEGRLDPTRRGVWFQDEEGFWYRSRYDAKKVACVQVDGHRFYRQAERDKALQAARELRETLKLFTAVWEAPLPGGRPGHYDLASKVELAAEVINKHKRVEGENCRAAQNRLMKAEHDDRKPKSDGEE